MTDWRLGEPYYDAFNVVTWAAYHDGDVTEVVSGRSKGVIERVIADHNAMPKLREACEKAIRESVGFPGSANAYCFMCRADMVGQHDDGCPIVELQAALEASDG